MTDVKALRALLAKTHLTDLRWSDDYPNASGGETWSLLSNGYFGYGVLSCDEDNAPDEDRREAIVMGLNALPDLLALAEAVRELAPLLDDLTHERRSARMYAADEMTDTQRDAARRVLAILDPTNEGDGR